ncbi:Pesticidal crystal protein cry14Aa [Bacillus subtilis]|nr:Pesticidal crystal protein cry14Aa [Bacillus subtilis]
MALNINQTSSAVTPPEDVAQVRAMVQGLFSTDDPNALAPGMTEYWIDYVQQQVQSLSDNFAVEKRELRDLVNRAKRLHKSRNLVASGSFEGSAWQLGGKVFISSGDMQYPARYLALPPSSLAHPSYAYQKVPESALKPNTRYYLSGFVLQADSLEIVASRYGKEINKVINVAPNDPLPTSADIVVHGSRYFQYPIDVGPLHSDADLGIEIGFRVPYDGFAAISHVALIEDRPLTAAEMRKVQNRHEKWQKSYTEQQSQMEASLQRVTGQLNAIYGSENWNSDIGPDVTYADLINLSILDYVSPKHNHWFMVDRPVEDAYTVKRRAVYLAAQRAWEQLEARNFIQNGAFLQRLQGWETEGTVGVTSDQNTKPMLTLTEWDATATQTISLPGGQEKEHRVRIRAKGEGTAAIVPLSGPKQTVSFNHPTFTTQEFYFYPEAGTDQVQLLLQSDGSEFTVDWIDIHKTELEEPENNCNCGCADSSASEAGGETQTAMMNPSAMRVNSGCGCKK